MKFKVGDVCVWKACLCRPLLGPSGHVGKECTIISIDPTDRDGAFYETNLPASTSGRASTPQAWACDNCLELKQPPPQREALGEWELCPWQPIREQTVLSAQSVK